LTDGVDRRSIEVFREAMSIHPVVGLEPSVVIHRIAAP